MPRKSAAAIATVPKLPGARPEPPSRLSESEAGLWREISQSKPAEWFTLDTLPMLEALCMTINSHRVLSDHVRGLQDGDLADKDRLKALHISIGLLDKQAQRMGDLATKLRLTIQSRYTPDKAGTAAKKALTERPWENVA